MSLKSDWSALLPVRKSLILTKTSMSNLRKSSTESGVPLLSDAETASPDRRRNTIDSPHHPEPVGSISVGTISKIKLQLDKICHRSAIEEGKSDDDAAAAAGHNQRDYRTILKEWTIISRGVMKSRAFDPFEEPALEALDEVFERWTGDYDRVLSLVSVRSLETIGEEEGLDFLEGDTVVPSPGLGDVECTIGRDGAEK